MVNETYKTDAELAVAEEDASQTWLSWIVKMLILIKFVITFVLLIVTFVVWVKTKTHPQRTPILTLIILCNLLLFGAIAFEYLGHYAHLYLILHALSTTCFVGIYYILLLFGATHLDDVHRMANMVKWPFLATFCLLGLLILASFTDSDFSGNCRAKHLPLPLHLLKLIAILVNVAIVTLHNATVTNKSPQMQLIQANETADNKVHRSIYE